MTVRVNGMDHRALRKRVGVPLRAPHVLIPKETYGLETLKDLGCLHISQYNSNRENTRES